MPATRGEAIVDLSYEGGSNTAEYGEYVSGRRIANDETEHEMWRVLADIQSGRFARDWILENRVNRTTFKAMCKCMSEHPIEQIDVKLGSMMPWITKNALVDKWRN